VARHRRRISKVEAIENHPQAVTEDANDLSRHFIGNVDDVFHLASTMTTFIRDHMLTDPALQQEIVHRIEAGNFDADQPGYVADPLGSIVLPDGKRVSVYLRHAADPVLLDCAGHVVLITRRNNPGAGLRALPGGFLDPIPDGEGGFGIEQGVTAALREAMEETGIAQETLTAANVTPVARRCYNRPFDIREAWCDITDTPILRGDLFAVSTQAFCVRINGDLSSVSLRAGDDATDVRVEQIAGLESEDFAVPDHLPMIMEALATCCQDLRS
jgi:8-oxo-dGTP pyrophosphatase MutT (NUDIX family)